MTLTTKNGAAQEVAQVNTDEAMDRLHDALPSEERMESLKSAMMQDAYNLDPYFEYAQLSMQRKEFAQAAEAYEHMLQLAPSLDRIKLELSLAYLQLGRFEDAKTLLEALKTREVPDRVRQNIDILLTRIEQATQQHFFSGSLAAGFNFDSNGNSAPDSGQVLVLDTLLNLTADSVKQSDWQGFASATLNHQYRADVSSPWQWRSSATYYKTEQDTLDDLNLDVLVAQTGPVYRFNEGRTQADLTAGYTHIFLNELTYLRQPSLEAGLEHAINPRLRVRGSLRREFRDFLNAPNVTTYEDRRGHTTQGRIAAYYSLTQQALLDVQLTLRYEEARAEQYSNLQIQPQIGLTYQWDNGIFARGQLGYRDYNYEQPDPFISESTRYDREKSVGLTVGKTIAEGVTVTLGYDYRDLDSNLTNYTFDNHRLSGVIGWQF
ncbi:MAG: surface lipoprotein assembly modifier [Rickettsiales bacterium]|nr:surface lipoprotein assembly modifier [Rickettsiales bacterium]